MPIVYQREGGAGPSGCPWKTKGDGDSYTTGSLVGQLLGAIHGERAIPGDWLESLEQRDTIEQLGRDIIGCRSWNLDYMSDDYDEAIVKRYPGG